MYLRHVLTLLLLLRIDGFNSDNRITPWNPLHHVHLSSHNNRDHANTIINRNDEDNHIIHAKSFDLQHQSDTKKLIRGHNNSSLLINGNEHQRYITQDTSDHRRVSQDVVESTPDYAVDEDEKENENNDSVQQEDQPSEETENDESPAATEEESIIKDEKKQEQQDIADADDQDAHETSKKRVMMT